jgi:hypothetical protein
MYEVLKRLSTVVSPRWLAAVSSRELQDIEKYPLCGMPANGCAYDEANSVAAENMSPSAFPLVQFI